MFDNIDTFSLFENLVGKPHSIFGDSKIVNLPMDCYIQDSNYVIEIGVVGKEKSQLHISSRFQNGLAILQVDVDDTTLDDHKREYIYNHLKTNGIQFDMVIPSDYDISKLTSRLLNGLLTITIPKIESAKDREYVIE